MAKKKMKRQKENSIFNFQISFIYFKTYKQEPIQNWSKCTKRNYPKSRQLNMSLLSTLEMQNRFDQ